MTMYNVRVLCVRVSRCSPMIQLRLVGGRRALCADDVRRDEKCGSPLHSGPFQNLGQGGLEENRSVHRF